MQLEIDQDLLNFYLLPFYLLFSPFALLSSALIYKDSTPRALL